MSASFVFEPSMYIDTPTHFKIWRKADTATPKNSYAVEDFTEYATINDATVRTYTDAAGDPDFLYRVQTCSNDLCAPPGPLIPGHGRSTFANLVSGIGWLSTFAPNALLDQEIYHEEHEATLFVIDEYLRQRYTWEQIFEFYKDPPPKIRQITAIHGALNLIAKHQPHLRETWEMYNAKYTEYASSFAVKCENMSQELEDVVPERDDPYSFGWSFDR